MTDISDEQPPDAGPDPGPSTSTPQHPSEHALHENRVRATRELAELATGWTERLQAFDATGAGGVDSEQRSLLKDATLRFTHNRAAMFSFVMLVIYIAMAIAVPMINSGQGTRQGPRELRFAIADKFDQPGGWREFVSVKHPLGYDRQGRDLFTRLWLGGRISLSIAFAVAAVILILGLLYGSISGYVGGRIDTAMMRILDALYGLPYLPFAIIIVTVVRTKVGDEHALLYLVPALTITSWFTAARIMRGQMMSLKSNEFVEAARSAGASGKRIVTRHIIPNTLGIMVVAIFLEIPNAILGEATLSFLGLGVQPPSPSWGQMANDGYTAVAAGSPSGGDLIYIWGPGFLIATTVLFAVAIADGLRDALDPRGRSN